MWIDVGLPDETDVRKACSRAEEVHIYAYGGRAAGLWWGKMHEKLEKQDRLTVYEVPVEASQALARLAERSMRLNCTVQEGHIWVANAATAVSVELVTVKSPNLSFSKGVR